MLVWVWLFPFVQVFTMWILLSFPVFEFTILMCMFSTFLLYFQSFSIVASSVCCNLLWFLFYLPLYICCMNWKLRCRLTPHLVCIKSWWQGVISLVIVSAVSVASFFLLIFCYFCSKFIKSFIQGFLPGIALKIFLILLPTILMIMSKFEGFLSISGLERRSASRYYIFNIVNVFLGSIIAGTAFQQLNKFIHQSANEYVALISKAFSSLCISTFDFLWKLFAFIFLFSYPIVLLLFCHY